MDRGRSARQHGDGPVGSAPAPPRFRWVSDQGSLDALVETLAEAETYALDTEFHRERTYYAQLALLQIRPGRPRGRAGGDRGEVALVDPLKVDVAPLREVLAGPGLCLMHAASQDLEILERACGTVPSRLVDTQVAAGFVGLGSPGLGVLLQKRLGLNLPKADRLTDWLRRPLPDDAAAYAAADVAYLDDLWDSLAAEIEARGRMDWLLDECDELRRRHGEPLDPERAWWRIKEARRLRGKARGVAQAVAAWRERRARELDKPVRHVLPDLSVVAIAERPPRSRKDLDRVRGLDGRHLRSGAGESLMAAVEAGAKLSEDDLKIPPRDGVDTTFRPAVTLASAWVGQLARDAELDPALVATRADIEALVRGEPSRLSTGWRARVAGGPVQRLLAGEAALAFDGVGSLVLEARSHAPVASAHADPADEPDPVGSAGSSDADADAAGEPTDAADPATRDDPAGAARVGD
ncbi:MAG TPA: HRDC domain-containing protein [Acidimicrobiales bacterium]